MTLGVDGATSPVSEAWEDPLALLPRKKPQVYRRDEILYSPGDPADNLFLLVDGAVKISRLSEGGRETVMDVESGESFFGISAILGGMVRSEMATALETSSVMTWGADELRSLMSKEPGLGPALMRMVATKLVDADSRLASFATDHVPKRLIKALLRLGTRFGRTSQAHSMVKLIPLTHELLAKHVGTSREIVTQQMTVLRKKGLINYSRAYIEFDPADLIREIDGLK